MELTAPAAVRPAGTRGHLVEVYPNGTGIVEVEGAAAETADPRETIVAVALDALRVLEPAPAST